MRHVGMVMQKTQGAFESAVEGSSYYITLIGMGQWHSRMVVQDYLTRDLGQPTGGAASMELPVGYAVSS